MDSIKPLKIRSLPVDHLRQILTSRRLLAQMLGADEDTAYNVGLTVDIAVPLVFASALGVARVAAFGWGN